MREQSGYMGAAIYLHFAKPQINFKHMNQKVESQIISHYWNQKLAGKATFVPNSEAAYLSSTRLVVERSQVPYFEKLTKHNYLAEYTVLVALYSTLIKRYFSVFEDSVAIGISFEEEWSTPANPLWLFSQFEGKSSLKTIIQGAKKNVEDVFQHKDVAIQDETANRKSDVQTYYSPFAIFYQKSNEAQQPKVSFQLQLQKDANGNLQFWVDYLQGFALKTTAEHFVEQLHIWLLHLDEFLDIPFDEISLFTDKDRALIIDQFNATEKAFPKHKTIVDLFEETVRKSPEALAVLYKGKSLSYQELNAEVNKLANFLIEEYAVKPNDVIGVLMPKSEQALISILAILKSGAAFLPIDINYPKQRIQYIIADSDLKLVLCSKEHPTDIGNYNRVVLEEISLENEADPEVQVKSDDLAYVIYTSGSTGKPKGVMIEHRSNVNMSLCQIEWAKVTSDDLVVWFASISFDATVSELMMTLYSGASLLIPTEEQIKNKDKFEALLKAYKPTVITMPPNYLDLLSEELVGQLRCLITAGEAAHVDKAARLAKKLSYFNAYGPTECAVCSTYYPVQPDDISRHSIPIGKPINNLSIYILDNNLQPVPIGVEGTLYLAGVGLARGYINKPELSQQKFIPNPFEENTLMYNTGDIGRWLEDGNIEFIGRRDDQVKIRGHRIELEGIKNTILSIDKSILQASVIVVEPNGEKSLAAYLVGQEDLDKRKLKEQLSEVLPEYMLPAYYYQLDKLPLNRHGKLDKKALPSVSAKHLLKAEYVAPTSSLEVELVQIWEEVLGLKKIGIADNFFELGGHSLLVAQIVNRIYKALGKSLSIKDFFAAPTIAGLSKKLRQDEFKPILKAAEMDSYPLTAAQNRLWVLSQLAESSKAYHISGAVKIRGQIVLDQLETAFQKLLDRHESLRTCFKTNAAGEVRQYIRPSTLLNFSLERYLWASDQVDRSLILQLLEEKNSISFDLENGPLVRALIIEVKKEEYIFFLTMHHIIADGWSMELLISEVLSVYDQLIQEGAVVLPPLDLQYKDYAVWQETLAETQRYQEAEKFWLQQFQGDLPVLNLPSFKTRPQLQTYEGEVYAHKFSPAFLQNIKAFSKKEEVTLFMVLLTGVNTLLHLYTAEEDIILGTPVAGRIHPDLENQIGLYLNTLAIRSELRSNQTFLELLYALETTLINAYQHQEYPFDELINKLNLKRDASRSALFDVMVVLQSQGQLKSLSRQKNIAGLQLESFPFNRKTSRFDLSLTFTEQEDLELEIEFNKDLYEGTWVENIGQHLETVLTHLTDKPNCQLAEIDYITKAERKLVLEDFNETDQAYPSEVTVLDLFAKQVQTKPEQLAIKFQGRALNYQALDELSSRLASCLIEEHQVAKGDLVAVLLQRSDWLIVSLLAILKTGAAYVPIDPNYPENRKDYILTDSACRVCIDLAFIQSFEQAKFNPMPKIEVEPKALAYVIYTSGSTGKPKGVMIEHHSLVNLSLWHQETYAVGCDSSATLYAGTGFDASVWEIFPYLTAGATLYPLGREETRLNLKKLVHFFKENAISHCYLPTPVCQELAAQNYQFKDLKILTGGDVLSLNTTADLNIYNNYGPTENTVVTTAFDLRQAYQRSIPIGKPISNTQVFVLSPGLKPQPIGVAGELCISGRSLARGYLNRPELDTEKFVENPYLPGQRLYKTGDLVRWLPDGNLEFIGRTDQQVKIRGYRIELGEIQHAIRSTAKGIQQVVVVVEEMDKEKALAAYYTAEKTQDALELLRLLKLRLPDYMVPRYFRELEVIPLTAHGKVDRKQLPPIEKKDLVREAYLAPTGALQVQIVEIWKQVLGLEQVGITDNFFELGGHSLTIAQVTQQMQRQLGKSLAFQDFYANPTVMGLSELLESNFIRPIPPSETSNSYQLTSTQFRFWLLCQMEHINATYNIPFTVRMKGDLNLPVLQQAFEYLLQRHESLRTCFLQSGTDEVVQEVLPMEAIQFNIPVLHCKEKGELQDAISSFNQAPFDLRVAPLLKAQVLHFASEDQYLCINIHHIISDGQSLQILVKELSSIYNSLIKGQESALPDLKLQHRDYVAWKQNNLQSRYQQEEHFWLEELSGELPILNMPTYRPRPGVQTYNGNSLSFDFDDRLREGLIHFSNQQKVTLFTTLLAGLNGLLSRYTNQRDIILGVPVSGRDHPDLDDQIGLFINTIPIRTRFSGDENFESLLKQQGEILQNAYTNSNYPFSDLVDKLHLNRDISRSPIFDVLVIHQRQADETFEIEQAFDGLSSHPYDEVRQNC